jgi:1,4-alpha-glucan branching enzyme
MIVYQLHVGTYAISKAGTPSHFLDVAAKIPYLAALGVNVLQPLPIDEQEQNPSMGYGGADLFSPDFPYVAAEADLPGYLAALNAQLSARGLAPLRLDDIASAPGQLKALVDLCHVNGIAVVLDVVYNHAGGFSSIISIARPIAATTTTASISPTRIAAPAASPSRCGTPTSRASSSTMRRAG